MNLSQIFTFLGLALCTSGVILALFSYRTNSKVMGDAALGIALISPDENSEEWKEKVKLRRSSDRQFGWGIALTIGGCVLQMIGAALSRG